MRDVSTPPRISKSRMRYMRCRIGALVEQIFETAQLALEPSARSACLCRSIRQDLNSLRQILPKALRPIKRNIFSIICFIWNYVTGFVLGKSIDAQHSACWSSSLFAQIIRRDRDDAGETIVPPYKITGEEGGMGRHGVATLTVSKKIVSKTKKWKKLFG